MVWKKSKIWAIMLILNYICEIMDFEIPVKFQDFVDNLTNLRGAFLTCPLKRPKKSKAKPYQVKQVRNIILKYKLGGPDDVEV